MGDNEIGAIFYHPEGKSPPMSERVPQAHYLNGASASGTQRFVTHYKAVPSGQKSPIET